MASTPGDIADLLIGMPSGAWVAISEQRHKVLAYGSDPQLVFNDARQLGEPQPLMVRIPDANSPVFL